jgi:hypothetical protein
MGLENEIESAVFTAMHALSKQRATDDINEMSDLLGDRAKYNEEGRVCVLQSLLALTPADALTPEEAARRGEWRGTMQVIQRALATIYRLRALGRDATLLLSEEAELVEASNCQVQVVLLVELLNWFAMKKATHASEVVMTQEWLAAGCHRGFATCFGPTLCNYISIKTGQDYATLYDEFCKNVQKKDARKTQEEVLADIEGAMRDEGRMVDVVIRMANGGRASDLADHFPDHRRAVLAACEEGLPAGYKDGTLEAPAANEPSHVETVLEAGKVLVAFREDQVGAAVRVIIRRGVDAPKDDESFAPHTRHLGALIRAYSQMK